MEKKKQPAFEVVVINGGIGDLRLAAKCAAHTAILDLITGRGPDADGIAVAMVRGGMFKIHKRDEDG